MPQLHDVWSPCLVMEYNKKHYFIAIAGGEEAVYVYDEAEKEFQSEKFLAIERQQNTKKGAKKQATCACCVIQ